MIDICFPKNFLWGAATSAYQVEGSPLADGAGPSHWHHFVHQPGNVVSGETGDIACDHYRRFAEDVALMQQLGLNAYRFSINWGRILPEGRGRINSAGLAFYHHLVDGLLEHGIQPCATLYHWDLPLALDEMGGWVNRDMAGWFAEYAHLLFRELGDKVPMWATLNEPWVTVDAGYLHGVHAPGHRSLSEAPLVAHNLLRAHALAVQAFRADGRGQIGLVVNLEPKYAASMSLDDAAAMNRSHAYMNRWFLDGVMLGAYPEELTEMFGQHWPRFDEADMRLIQEPFDFLGINYYTRTVNHDAPDALPPHAEPVRQEGAEYTELSWEVFPEGLSRTLLWVKRRYGAMPLYITENGAAFLDPPAQNERVADPRRVAYLRSHLQAAVAAMQQGVDLRGYFVWSLLDNFEWSLGYAKTFGLVQVDFATQQRTIKDSGYFYRDVIASDGAALIV